MYNTFLHFPLFQGLSQEQLSQFLEKTVLDFQKFEPDERIFKQGSPCDKLHIILQGTILLEQTAGRNKPYITQLMDAPNALALHCFFGQSPKLPFSAYAYTQVGMMSFSKSSFLNLLQTQPICLINYVNLICNRIQKKENKAYLRPLRRTDEMFLSSLLKAAEPGAKEITFLRGTQKMADFCGLSKPTLLKLLNRFQAKGYLTYSPKEITLYNIPDLLKQTIII